MEFSSRSRYSREYSKRNENREHEDTQEVTEIKKWDELDISQDLLRGIYSYGFEHPSPIQAKAIRPIIEKHDVVAQAQSGTGKTAAFTIGLLSRIDLEMQQVQAVVLVPTRELATQITQVIKSISEMMTGFSVYTLVGGKSVDMDIISLQSKPPHTIVSCPGRLYDILKRGVISTENINQDLSFAENLTLVRLVSPGGFQHSKNNEQIIYTPVLSSSTKTMPIDFTQIEDPIALLNNFKNSKQIGTKF